jgi:PAS domain S-box-containing protein
LKASNVDIIYFRRIAFAGSALLMGLTLMNANVETGLVDFPLPRILIALTLFSLAVASFRVRFVQTHCLKILYFVFAVYNAFGIYLVAANNFQVFDTSTTIIIGFALGAFFKEKLYLNLYLVFVFFAYLFFFLTCSEPEVSADYLFTVLILILLLGQVMYTGKIKAMDSLTKSQKQLARSEERFRKIFESSPIGIMLLDKDLKPFKLNSVVANMLGYTEEEVNHISMKKYIHEEDLVSCEELIQKMEENENNNYALEQRFIRKDKTIIWVRTTMAFADLETIGDHYIVAMMEDITFQKKANVTLKEYAGKLETHNKALEEFSYVISHDLQEPLRMIRSYTSLIKRRYIDKLKDKDAHIDMSYVIDGAERMSILIKDMLAYSRWSAKPFKLEPVDTRGVLVEVLKNLTISIADKNAEVYCYDMPKVDTNRLLFGQVLQNLIGNGLKYNHEGREPRIEIKGEQRDFDIVFSVKDNGQGFDEKDKDRIFGIFQRLHGRDSKYTGTGIGLAICKRIIEKQGGQIWAEGEKGAGATFYFTLPLETVNAS